MTRRALPLVAFAMVTACATGPRSGAPAIAGAGTSAAAADTALGFGTLHQEQISIKLSLPNVRVDLLPTAESVIRVLAPDSYRIVSNIVASHAAEIDRRAQPLQLRERQVWMVTFVGLSAGARFAPGDFAITQSGREYRPVAMIPITRGFGDGRLQPGEAQKALYLLEDGLSLTQPMVVTVGGVRSAEWETVLQEIDREKALMRARKR